MINNLVSVIIPVYGVEQYLDRCLESVVSQTYQNTEIILVDDGSPDNCPAMCDAWAKKDDRINVIHKENGGLTSARKAGFDIATGEHIIFFDSDDYVEANIIEKLLDAAVKTEKDIAMCSYYMDKDSRVEPVVMSYNNSVIEKDELRDSFIFPIIAPLKADFCTNGFMVTKLIKKSKIKEEYFVSERECYTEDIVFNANIALEINGIAIVNEPLYHYCFNPDSLTLKYRESKYELTTKRADYFEKFFKKNGWEEITRDRVILLNMWSVLLGIDNDVLLNDYSFFENRCRIMRNNTETNGYLKIKNIKYLTASQKITMYLLLFKFYRILFFYRKKRVGV